MNFVTAGYRDQSFISIHVRGDSFNCVGGGGGGGVQNLKKINESA